MSETLASSTLTEGPNYSALVKFLMEPFLDHPEALRISSEQFANGTRHWLRISMSESDRGRAYGRGGRNIQSIRQVLESVGKASGHMVSLEIYEENRRSRPPSSSSDTPAVPKSPPTKRSN